jgi:hypothetical protein
MHNLEQISSPKSTPLVQPVTHSVDHPQPVLPRKTHNRPAINTTTPTCNIDAEPTPQNPHNIAI